MEQDFRLCVFNFNEKEKPKILKIQEQFQDFIKENDCPVDFFTNFQPEFLENLKISALQELLLYKSVRENLEDIHIKTMRSNEYKSINKFIPLISEKLEYYRTVYVQLEESLRKNYSHISSENPLLSLLYPYGSFKDFFNELLNPQVLTMAKLQEYKSGDFFEICRQGILQRQFEVIPALINGGEINLPELLVKFPKIYNLLAGEFFFQYNKELTGSSIFTGQTYALEFIRPAHPMAEQFKLATFEGALLAISLDPLPSVGLKIGDKVNFFDLSFEIKDPGVEAYKIDISWPLTLNKTQYIINCPVYFAHYRLQLIATQRLRNAI